MLKQEEMIEVKVAEKNTVVSAVKTAEQGINTICKGSKIIGNMVVSQDLHMDGDIEGNITAENNASIFIKGTCKGTIDAKGGSVEIEGEMSAGNINDVGSVKVTGKFLGGKIVAKNKIHIDGEFSGSLESNDVELGPAARGKVEILYKDTLCIQKGARVEGNITRAGTVQKPVPERIPERIPERVPERIPERKAEPKRHGFFKS